MRYITFFILLLAVFNSFSQEPDTLKTHPEPMYQLEGVSIVAEKYTQAIGKIEVKKWDLREIPSEISIADAITDISGINISQGGKDGAELSIRGFEKEDVMIMMDGRPVGGGYFDTVDLSTLTAFEIKEIQVIKGPASALYGSNTMGGVVNIITKKPDDSNSLKLLTQFQRNNTSRFQITSVQSHDFLSLLFSIARYNTDGFVLSNDFEPKYLEDGGIRDYTAQEQFDLKSRLNFDIFDLHQIGFSAAYTWMDEKQIPVATDEYYNPTYPNDIFRKFIDWQRYQIAGEGVFYILDNQVLNLNLYHDAFDDIYQTYKKSGYVDLDLDSHLLSWNRGAIAKYTVEFENLNFILGHRTEKQEYKRKDNIGYLEWISNWQILHNSFLQAEYSYNDLTFTAGSGLSFFDQPDRDKMIYHIEPSFGVLYNPGKRAEYNLAVSNNVNYPSMHELFSSSSGNPDLKEETAWKFELSTLQPFKIYSLSGNLEFTAFYNIIDNLVDKVALPNYSQQYDNIDQVSSYGFEASAKLKLISEHSIQYCYLDYSEDSDKPVNENPRNVVKFNEKIELPFEFFFVYDASWHDITHSEGKLLGSYWLHNFYLNRSLSRFKVKLGLENAFDENYQEKYGYPQPGWDFIISLETKVF